MKYWYLWLYELMVLFRPNRYIEYVRLREKTLSRFNLHGLYKVGNVCINERDTTKLHSFVTESSNPPFKDLKEADQLLDEYEVKAKQIQALDLVDRVDVSTGAKSNYNILSQNRIYPKAKEVLEQFLTIDRRRIRFAEKEYESWYNSDKLNCMGLEIKPHPYTFNRDFDEPTQIRLFELMNELLTLGKSKFDELAMEAGSLVAVDRDIGLVSQYGISVTSNGVYVSVKRLDGSYFTTNINSVTVLTDEYVTTLEAYASLFPDTAKNAHFKEVVHRLITIAGKLRLYQEALASKTVGVTHGSV